MKKSILKPIYTIISTFIVAIAFSSCCQAIDCSTGHLDAVTTINFSRQELSNFSIKKFAKNSNFTKLIDSMNLSEGTYYKLETAGIDRMKIVFDNLPMRFQIAAGYDYEFMFPNGNNLRRITDITESQTSEKFCHTGFAKNQCYNNIISLKVDGLDQAFPVFRK